MLPRQPLHASAFPRCRCDGPHYVVKGAAGEVDTGVPLVLGEYVKFTLNFDTAMSTFSVFVNDQPTDALDVPFENPSAGITTIRSNHVSDPGGSARWYLDNVSVVPEPSTALLFGLATGSILFRRKAEHTAGLTVIGRQRQEEEMSC